MPNQKTLNDLIYRPATTLGRLCGYDRLTALHDAWIRQAWDSDGPQAMLAFRGSYKTSAVIIIGIIRYLILFPDRRVILVRKTQMADAAPTLQTISRLMGLEIVRLFFTDIHGGEFRITENTQTRLRLSTLPAWYKEGSVNAFGIGDSITGTHGDAVVTDDILNINDRVSAAARQKTLNSFYELQNIIENTGRVKQIFNGTRWHPQDVWEAVSKAGAEFHEYPASLYWNGLFPEGELEKKKASMTPALFAINYELTFMKDESLLFQDPDMSGVIDGELWRTGQWAVMHVDAAYGGSDTTALTVAQGDNRLGRLWEGHVQNRVAEIAGLYRKYRCQAVYCENNSDKGYLARELEKAGLGVVKYHERENKAVKIATYLYPPWKNLKWCPETDAEYMAQVLDWSETAKGHDDAPDSAASVQRIVDRNGGKIKFERLQ